MANTSILNAFERMWQHTVNKIDEKISEINTNPSVQSDWNENDPNAEGYITNRPFYEDYVPDEELLAEHTVELTGSLDDQISDSLTFIDGETYFVTFNGELYECVAWSSPYGAICVGNGSLCGGVETGSEPFACISYDDGSCYISVAEAGTHTIKIQSAALEVAKKIDKKFLPDDIGGQVIVDSELSAESENPVQNKVVNEAISNVNEAISNVNEAISNLSGLVGDVSVSDQIDAAIAEIPKQEQVQADWNQYDQTKPDYIKNRTHYVLSDNRQSWNGTTGYLESFDVFYRVTNSEQAQEYTNLRLKEATMTLYQKINGEEKYLSGSVADMLDDCLFEEDFAIIGQHVLVVRKDGATYMGLSLPEAGVYFIRQETDEALIYVSDFSIPDEVRPISEIYIPETIARKDDFYHHKKGGLIHNTTITTTKASESTTLASCEFNADFMSSLTLGNWYIVEFNGVEYMCKYSVNPYGSATLAAHYLGNMYMQHYYNWTDAGNKTEDEVTALLEVLGLKDSGEPFSIDSYGWIYTKGAGTYIVNIYEADIIQIDEQYIPNAFIHIDDLYDRGAILPVKTYYQWDDNVVYDEVVAAPEGQPFAGYAKISDDTPESSFFVGKYAYVTGYTGGVIKSDWARIRSSDITAFDGYYSILNMFVVTADTIDVNGAALTKGIWAEDGQDKSQSSYIMKMRFTDSNKIISETVIPDTIARVGDAISAPLTAQVGQTIVVKSVDENGKPTEWECVDPWVMTSSTEGSTKQFKITIDDSGTLTIAEII